MNSANGMDKSKALQGLFIKAVNGAFPLITSTIIKLKSEIKNNIKHTIISDLYCLGM